MLLLLGMLGGLLKKRTPVSEPLIALIAGVLIGPAALGLLARKTQTRHLPSESGFNDVLVLTEPPGEVLGHWLTHTVLLEIVAGAAPTGPWWRCETRRPGSGTLGTS